jgi:multiple sugar transport system permease protein
MSNRRNRPGAVALHVVLGIGSLAMVAPLVWMVLSSLKSLPELLHAPPSLLPHHLLPSNYPNALKAAPFLTYFRNSFVLATSHTLINLLIASMAGYSLARVPFRGRNALLFAVLMMMMIPTYAKIVPQYLIAKSTPLFGGNDILGRGGSGWLDTWWALIIPGAVTPFAVFLFRQFYLSLPYELEEAARIDGLSEFGIYRWIMSPLLKPAFATVALLTFQESWNNFLWPLLVTTSTKLRVIQVGLTVFQSEDGTEWTYLLAASALATAPMVILFLCCQKYFVQGFATAGIK